MSNVLATRHKSSTPRSRPAPPSPTSEYSSPKSYSSSFIRGFVYATAGFLAYHIATGYIFSIGPCYGISMQPTINSWGDYVLVSNYYRRGRGVKVGDVISYTHPIRPHEKAVKRVIGMEGDFVLRDTPGIDVDEGEQKMLQVPQGHCWVVGDSLKYSRDSRLFGPLPLALIKGKVVTHFQPGWRMNKLEGLREPERVDDVD